MGEHINVRVVTEAPGMQVLADAGEIEQILMNLASNARDAMPGGGALTFSTHVEGSHIALAVRDTGGGMSTEVQARVFEPFLRRRRGPGTGLGLSTVFVCCPPARRNVALDSSEGHGTTVTVRLRLRRQGETSLREPAASDRGRTILIVDDDPLVRATVENYLERWVPHPSVESVAEAMSWSKCRPNQSIARSST